VSFNTYWRTGQEIKSYIDDKSPEGTEKSLSTVDGTSSPKKAHSFTHTKGKSVDN